MCGFVNFLDVYKWKVVLWTMLEKKVLAISLQQFQNSEIHYIQKLEN